ncbi:MAG: SRPBCC family protein [Planctomycetota bacterium]
MNDLDEHFERRLDLEATPREVWDWHMRPEALAELTPSDRDVKITARDPEIAPGSRVHLEIGLGPFRRRWVALHDLVEAPHRFRDVQESGPFALWEHEHVFEARPDGGCTLVDRIRYRLPFGRLGRRIAGAFVRRDLERLVEFRHRVTAAALGRQELAT